MCKQYSSSNSPRARHSTRLLWSLRQGLPGKEAPFPLLHDCGPGFESRKASAHIALFSLLVSPGLSYVFNYLFPSTPKLYPGGVKGSRRHQQTREPDSNREGELEISASVLTVGAQCNIFTLCVSLMKARTNGLHIVLNTKWLPGTVLDFHGADIREEVSKNNIERVVACTQQSVWRLSSARWGCGENPGWLAITGLSLEPHAVGGRVCYLRSAFILD